MVSRLTIRDIAQELGVSTATVSNVIHARLEKMSPQTAQRVREKLEQYQYVPNMGARMLAKGGSRIIGVVFCYPVREDKSAFQDTFVAEMVGSLENEIRSSGYFMMPYVARNAEEICKVAQTWNAGGLIVWGIMPEECRKLNEMGNQPIVFVDCYFDSASPIYNIGSDDFRGGRMGTRHLLSMGHRRIAFLCDQQTPVGVDACRLEGYRAALQEAGLPFEPGMLITLKQNRREQLKDYAALTGRIRRGEVTALFYASDYYAVLGIHALHHYGLRVPEDCSVVGYDDSQLATMVCPPLTSIHQNVTEKARRAAKLLFELLENPENAGKGEQISVSIVKRGSVKRHKP